MSSTPDERSAMQVPQGAGATDARSRARPGTDPRRWWTLAVLCLSLLIIGIDNSILNVAIPTLVRKLGVSTSQLQWIVDAYVLVFAGLLLTMGNLGDRRGRKGVMTTGLVLFGLASTVAAFSAGANALIVCRAVMGCGADPGPSKASMAPSKDSKDGRFIPWIPWANCRESSARDFLRSLRRTRQRAQGRHHLSRFPQ